jgi:hypothetical protein
MIMVTARGGHHARRLKSRDSVGGRAAQGGAPAD